MPARSLALIVSTYNRPEALAKVLRGIGRQSVAPDEVFISDDGSGPATRDLVNAWSAGRPFPVRHVWHPDEGFRKTIILNATLAQVRADYVVTTDGDCVPERHFVADHRALAERGCWVQGRRCFVKEPFVEAFEAESASLLSWWLRGRLSGVGKGVRLPVPIVRRDTEQRGIIGCNMAFWREDLEAVNGFDEAYSGWGIGEDSDVGTRLYHLGRRRKFVYGRAVTFHLNHPSAPKTHVDGSLARLADTIRSGKVRCERGLDRHRSTVTP
jgi:glycosyltransferase involved in cell wall biosynthesis